MRRQCVINVSFGLVLAGSVFAAEVPPQLREYRDFAMSHDGNVSRGRELFNDERRVACAMCHSVDGSVSKAGPDLFAIGDKFPRRELIQAVQEPSAAISVGYGTTIVETKTGEEFQGIVKETTADGLDLVGADGKHIRIAARDIKEQRGSTVSLMPEGLQAGLSRQELTDLIEYLVTLKQPENALTSNRGMPTNIPELARPIEVRPFFGEQMRFPHNFVHKPGDVRYGLVWFGQLPGASNLFLAVHQTGKIWLLEKSGTNEAKMLFADISHDIFNERGPNGLLSIALHPKFRENRRYFLKHQVFEDGKIATIVVERRASADLRSDSGQPSRRLWKVVSTTQDHSGGYIGFGPDGFLYIAMGDTGPQQDPQGHGQDLTTHLAKILRIDVDHTDAGLTYAVPPDNPFVGDSSARPEIWAYGFREPWRFSFDTQTGDLWVGDVGQDRVEEVCIVRRGENHGWNVYEGFEPFSNRYRKEGVTYTPPVFAYRRKFGNSITGGYVYRGDRRSSFYGVYICGDYTSHRIFGLKQQDRTLQVVRQIGTAPQGIASFAVDGRGEIYLVGYEGMIYQLDLSGTSFDDEMKSTSFAARGENERGQLNSAKENTNKSGPTMKTNTILALLALATLARAQQDFSKVEIKATHVAGNIYMLTGAGGNIGVSVGPDGILIVDDQFAPLAPKIEAALKQFNPGKLKFVLNTHYHGDHTGGNKFFGQQAHIIAHTNVRKRLGGTASDSKPELPIITFDDSLSVWFNGEEINLVHVPPAHTDSDSIVYFTDANVIHFGDTFFSGRFPNIDLGGGGDVRGYIRNVENALKKVPADAKLIPGHGPLSTVKELKEFHQMLVETSGIVEKAIADGKTLEQVKADGLPEKWKNWEAPTLKTDRWLEILYRGLKPK